MNKLVLVVFLFFGIVQYGISQKSLSDYSYVVVSEQFEFQNEKDKYQLNSLTKFLFNKYGFHAFFNDDVPINVMRCDGLWAEAEGTPGFIFTKVQIVLKDCHGDEVFRTQYGKSKVKDYKKAYYESVRKAFDEFIAMDVQQKEIEQFEIVKKENTGNTSVKKENPVVAVAVVKPDNSKQIVVKDINTESQSGLENLPKTKYTSYSNNGKTFLLRKTSLGYNLYQESLNEDDDLLLIGKIIVKDSNLYFEKENKDKVKASFDDSKNLSIDEGKNKTDYKFEN